MNDMQTKLYILLLTALALHGCIGTDFVDEPLGSGASEADIAESELALSAQQTHQLNFRLLATDGTEIDAEWAWSTRNADVATVSTDGLVEAVAAGQTWIDGVANALFRDSVLVTVAADENSVATITISGETSNMEIGDTRQLSVTLRNIEGDEVSGDVVWTSENEDVATVSSTGLVTAVADGSSAIVATSDGVSSVPFAISVSSGAMVRSGVFSGRNGYNAEGTVTLSDLGGDAVLAFDEDFQTQSGPGLYVYLSDSDQSVTGQLSLGELISTSGPQSYTLPGTANPEDYNFVVIYCQPFGVFFGAAELE